MEKLFRYEKDLVDTFITNYFDKKNKISLKELPIRWGNIDIAFILGNKKVPFNSKQIEAKYNYLAFIPAYFYENKKE